MGIKTARCFIDNYPDGTGLDDPNAPWNQPIDYSYGEDYEDTWDWREEYDDVQLC